VTFSVTASSAAPLSYQWRKGGIDIGGATGSSYTISSVALTNAGSYDVVVTNSCDSVTSDAATLTVNSAKVGSVIVGDQSGTLTYGTAASATYTVTVTRGSGTGAFDAALSVTTTLPTGATAAFSRGSLVACTSGGQKTCFDSSNNTIRFATGDSSLSALLTINTTTATPAGATPFTVKASTSASDYAINTGTLTVGAKAITVTPDPGQFKVYGAADPVFTYTNSPALESGDVFSGALGRVAGTNAGTYAYTLNTLSAGTNYTLSLGGSNTFEIRAKAITVTPDAGQFKIYGAADPVFTYTNTPLEAGGSFTGALGRVAGANVGTYAYTLGDLSAGTNYTLSLGGSNTFEIRAKPITVTPDPGQFKIYGVAADPVFTYTNSPALESGDVFSGALGRDPGSDVGQYNILQGTLVLSTNYNLVFTAGAKFTIDQKTITVTPVAGQHKTYGDADPVPLTYGFTPALVNGDSFSGALGRDPGSDVGQYNILQGTLALSTNYNLVFTAGVKFTIDKRPTTTTVTTLPTYAQYSDPVTLTAIVSAGVYGVPITGTVVFTINGNGCGSVTLPGTPGNQTVSTTVAVMEPPNPSTPVTATFTPDASDINYSGSNGTANLKVQPENATPIGEAGAYTGQTSAWTPTATSNTATLTLAATIKDISVDSDNDPWPGDITKARISFAFRSLSTGVLTPINGATNLPVGLVNAGQKGIGTAAATLQFSLNSNEICSNYTVAVMVGGNYNMPTPSYQDVQISVCRATPGSILSNPGAKLDAIGSAGFIAGESVTNFDIKYNKSGTNPQGKAKVVITSDRNAATGLPDGKIHTYVITSNAISSLSVKPPNANFAAKANVVELVANPDGSVTAIGLDSGTVLQLALTDAASDTLAVMVNKSRGGLWFSSNWDGSKTVEKGILNNGAIKITP